jgi:hypothetical protein
MRAIVHDAFQQWTTADCGNGATPRFVVDMFPDVNCTDVTGDAGYKPTGPNYNLWIFEDSNWDLGDGIDGAIAITTTQFNALTGEIYDSDVELNSKDNPFTMDYPSTGMDLQSVVQHESGHFLGIAHTDINLPSIVMYPNLSPGATRRLLQPDDIGAICAAYPPGTLDPNCDPEPRHGFSTECEFNRGCCTILPGRKSGRFGSSSALLLGAIVTAVAARRRNRRDLPK